MRIAQGVALGINTGSSAIFAAILRASSLLSNLAAERRPGSFLEIDIRKLLAGVVAHDEAGVQFLDSPRRREAEMPRKICGNFKSQNLWEILEVCTP